MNARRLEVHITADTSLFVSAMHLIAIGVTAGVDRRRHRRRCDFCSPFANPRPLSIDGHAYHRRTRARRRRS